MPKPIGIVGCSAEGAALCYKTICIEAGELLGEHAHPEVSMHTHSLSDYVQCLDMGDLKGVGELMLSSAQKLASIGAEVLICPDNTIHQAFSYVSERTVVPWLHIAEVVTVAAHGRGFRRLGVLGTRWLVESDVYPRKLADRGLECLRPKPAEVTLVNNIIMDELVCGIQHSGALASLQGVIRNLETQGCDAVVLGCTELPLVLNDANSPLPTLDSTRLLARAALRFAIA